MKTVTILLCFSLIPILVFPQWHWQNPLPQGNSLESVFFTDSNTGYAVGDAGTILKTTNGGSTWTIYSSGPDYTLHSVYFTDLNTGYAAGSSSTGTLIIKTNDAGVTWYPVYNQFGAWLNSIYFTDANHGYIAGDYTGGIIAKTDNSGASWTPIQTGTFGLISIVFPDGNTGYGVSGMGIIEKTTNAGLNWDL